MNALLNPTSENLQRSALGLLDYFEAAIGTILLYKFERPMFNDLHEQLEKEKIEETENERMKTSNGLKSLFSYDDRFSLHPKFFGQIYIIIKIPQNYNKKSFPQLSLSSVGWGRGGLLSNKF